VSVDWEIGWIHAVWELYITVTGAIENRCVFVAGVIAEVEFVAVSSPFGTGGVNSRAEAGPG